MLDLLRPDQSYEPFNVFNCVTFFLFNNALTTSLRLQISARALEDSDGNGYLFRTSLKRGKARSGMAASRTCECRFSSLGMGRTESIAWR
jgi:hypothetical protein